MLQAEAGRNVEEARKIAAALTLQAACYFQQGQVRTANGQLDLIPNGLDSASHQRIELIKAVLQQQVDPPLCARLLEHLVAVDSSITEQARLTLLIMYLRTEYMEKASGLLDDHEVGIREMVTDEDWRMIETALVSAYDNPSGAKLYSEVMQEAEENMGYLQTDIGIFKQSLDSCEDENAAVGLKRKLAKKEAKLATVKLSLRMATVGLANLHYKKRNYKEAVRCLQKYIEDCQDDIVYCTALAHCLFMAKNYTESSFIYHTIIEFYKSTSFTLISTPVAILSQYCVAQLFATDEENKASEVMAEMLRSEKVNFEDPESDYHVVAAKRTHVVATCLLIAYKLFPA
ncbi:hypothetical protein RvY_04797 [Ramazzottius varieornatus]|uniref:Tetratricopeptide repeat protein 30 n=1 Tax=Ramazzottius varieornatus TaxID=947166 RepID=A0A1D1UST9_RAMVA|nr:hypothetical protein RvY_04797 [Ramazzottius varieornatus]